MVSANHMRLKTSTPLNYHLSIQKIHLRNLKHVCGQHSQSLRKRSKRHPYSESTSNRRTRQMLAFFRNTRSIYYPEKERMLLTCETIRTVLRDIQWKTSWQILKINVDRRILKDRRVTSIARVRLKLLRCNRKHIQLLCFVCRLEEVIQYFVTCQALTQNSNKTSFRDYQIIHGL